MKTILFYCNNIIYNLLLKFILYPLNSEKYPTSKEVNQIQQKQFTTSYLYRN